MIESVIFGNGHALVADLSRILSFAWCPMSRWLAVFLLLPVFFVSSLSRANAAPPQLPNKAWVLMDYDSGAIIAQSNADLRLGPASLTKLMTSYLVERALVEGRLREEDMASVSENAWRRGTNQESTMFLPLGGQARIIDLLRGIIIVSGNDACSVVAEHMAGTEAAFANLMNDAAHRLGMKNSHFMNASGLPDPNHYSTAHDMALLAHGIIRDNARYYGIYSEKQFAYGGHNQGNRNLLLYSDASVDGLKTGHTEESGFSLVASAKRNGTRLISVVMGTDSMQARAEQSEALLNWGFAFYESYVPYRAGTVLQKMPLWMGANDTLTLGLDRDLAAVIPRGMSAQVKLYAPPVAALRAPMKKGTAVGKVMVQLQGKTLAEVPLVTMEDAPEGNFFKRLWHRIRLFFAQLF